MQEKISIFYYIWQNINRDGFFASSNLPDRQRDFFNQRLGEEDAYYYTTETPPDIDGAKQIAELLHLYELNPVEENKANLYDALLSLSAAAICDPLLERLSQTDVGEDVFALAEEFFYTSSDREPVKFAYLIFAVYGMGKIKAQKAKLWHDLLIAARCEEFTFFFLYACRASGFMPAQEVWQLAQCTLGWGKVYALNEAECANDAQRDWLVTEGCNITVDYPPLSVKLIRESRLDNILKRGALPYSFYKGAGVILNNFLLLLYKFNAQTLKTNFNIDPIDLNSLLTDFLRHAENFAVTPEETLDVISLSFGLHNLADAENWLKLSPNESHTLIAACEKIIYRRNWEPEIRRRLIRDGMVNYALCDFALELDIDVWPQLFAYFTLNPEEIKLFPYLLSSGDEARSAQVLKAIEKNIYLYLSHSTSLLAPLQYLRRHPGQGESIVIAALNALHDWPRGIACMLLEDWDLKSITPPLRAAVFKARQLAVDEKLQKRLDALLKKICLNQ